MDGGVSCFDVSLTAESKKSLELTVYLVNHNFGFEGGPKWILNLGLHVLAERFASCTCCLDQAECNATNS